MKFFVWLSRKSFIVRVLVLSCCVGLVMFFYTGISSALLSFEKPEYRMRHHFARQSWFRHYSPSLNVIIKGNSSDNTVTVTLNGNEPSRVILNGAIYRDSIFVGKSFDKEEWLIVTLTPGTHAFEVFVDRGQWESAVLDLGFENTELLPTGEVFRSLPDIPSPYGIIIEDMMFLGILNFIGFFVLSIPVTCILSYFLRGRNKIAIPRVSFDANGTVLVCGVFNVKQAEEIAFGSDQLAALIRDVREFQGNCVRKYQGDVFNEIGDSSIAFWVGDDSLLQGVQAALEIIDSRDKPNIRGVEYEIFLGVSFGQIAGGYQGSLKQFQVYGKPYDSAVALSKPSGIKATHVSIGENEYMKLKLLSFEGLDRFKEVNNHYVAE